MTAGSRATRTVAEVLRKRRVVLLHPSCRAAVAIGHRSIDHIKATLPFIQPNLMIGLQGGVGEIHRAPLDVEDTIGRCTRHRGEHTAQAPWVTRATNPPQIIRALVVPVSEDGIVVGEPRQANVGKVGSRGRELSRPIGRYIDARERRVVQCEWERQWNSGHYIITMIAGVCSAWHDTAPYLTDRVYAAGRCRCRCRRRREGSGS